MKRDFSNITEGLNSAQKEAVEQIMGASLIIAGAGSGKTKVLTCRIANILHNGHNAGRILALTFTNKASKEMRERIVSLVGYERAKGLWMGTFHSVFARFLREDAQLLGFPQSYTIYDTSDSKSAIKGCIKDLGLSDKIYKPNEVLSRISKAKNNLITAQAYMSNSELTSFDMRHGKSMIGEIYKLYEQRCRLAGAMDFDDILLYTNILFRDFPQVLDKFRERFSFILVDEYQDTNYAQYIIVKKLASVHGNICVVGDDSQSIYAFRGARIENIFNFLKDYPGAKQYKLEQNYRSTKTIVNAANSLIEKNSNRLNKECFSMAESGELIEVIKGYTDQDEAFSVVSALMSRLYEVNGEYSDFAILYRTNAQSRVVEEALRKRSVPYKIYGGHSFYERVEVKDVLAYMRLLINPKDNEAFKRVVNVPARGIGDTTVSRLTAAAGLASLSMWEAFHQGDLDAMGIKPAAANRIAQFVSLIDELGQQVSTTSAYNITMEILVRSGYMEYLKADTTLEGRARLDNVEELFNSIRSMEEYLDQENFDQEGDVDVGGIMSLEEFVERISLLSAIDNDQDKDDVNKVSLMTVHSAKGLEFPHIYVIGMEDSLFPSTQGFDSEDEIEEERRLFYVALTRAMKSVTLSYAQTRFRWGSHVSYRPSRFLKEINPIFLNWPSFDSSVEQRVRLLNTRFSTNTKPSISSSSYNSYSAANQQTANSGDQTFTTGAKVVHERFGEGVVLEIQGEQQDARVIVNFDESGRKTLLLKFAKLRVIS